MTINILIVDDDKFMVSLVKQYASVSNFGTFEAYDGNQALKALAKVLPAVDLVLTDLHMPVMNGTVLANTLKSDKKYAHIPIILMTSDMEVPNKFSTDSQFKPFDDILPKPFTLNEMLSKINKLLSSGQYSKQSQQNQ